MKVSSSCLCDDVHERTSFTIFTGSRARDVNRTTDRCAASKFVGGTCSRPLDPSLAFLLAERNTKNSAARSRPHVGFQWMNYSSTGSLSILECEQRIDLSVGYADRLLRLGAPDLAAVRFDMIPVSQQNGRFAFARLLQFWVNRLQVGKFSAITATISRMFNGFRLL